MKFSLYFLFITTLTCFSLTTNSLESQASEKPENSSEWEIQDCAWLLRELSKPMHKGEFERTVDYEERLKKENKSRFARFINKEVEFISTPSLAYDADLEVWVDTTSPTFAEMFLDSSYSMDSIENAFGANKDVSRIKESTCSLYAPDSTLLTDIHIPMNISLAPSAKDKIRRTITFSFQLDDTLAPIHSENESYFGPGVAGPIKNHSIESQKLEHTFAVNLVSVEYSLEAKVLPHITEASLSDLLVSVRDVSWIKVVDSTGEDLLFGIKAEGDFHLKGKAPFEMTIGAPQHVKLHLDGKPIDISFADPKRTLKITVPVVDKQ
jgi:hypothetical protein